MTSRPKILSVFLILFLSMTSIILSTRSQPLGQTNSYLWRKGNLVRYGINATYSFQQSLGLTRILGSALGNASSFLGAFVEGFQGVAQIESSLNFSLRLLNPYFLEVSMSGQTFHQGSDASVNLDVRPGYAVWDYDRPDGYIWLKGWAQIKGLPLWKDFALFRAFWPAVSVPASQTPYLNFSMPSVPGSGLKSEIYPPPTHFCADPVTSNTPLECWEPFAEGGLVPLSLGYAFSGVPFYGIGFGLTLRLEIDGELSGRLTATQSDQVFTTNGSTIMSLNLPYPGNLAGSATLKFSEIRYEWRPTIILRPFVWAFVVIPQFLSTFLACSRSTEIFLPCEWPPSINMPPVERLYQRWFLTLGDIPINIPRQILSDDRGFSVGIPVFAGFTDILTVTRLWILQSITGGIFLCSTWLLRRYRE